MTVETVEMEEKIAQLQARLALVQERCEILQIQAQGPPFSNSQLLSNREKLLLFQSLFKGRTNLYSRRWESLSTGKSGYALACASEWVKGVCEKPKMKCWECPVQAFLVLEDRIVAGHLAGNSWSRSTSAGIGIHPLLEDETCWFFALRFEESGWKRGVEAFLAVCRKKGVPAVVEQLGAGAHVWVFFSDKVRAAQARKMGSLLITEAMEEYPEMGLGAYDRMFPSQDKGWDQPIALPLQNIHRGAPKSFFLGENGEPSADQWVFLAGLQKMSGDEVASLVHEAGGRLIGVKMPWEEESKDPWVSGSLLQTWRRRVSCSLPKEISVEVSDRIYLNKEELPSPFINQLIRLAAFQNLAFVWAQAMRRSAANKARIIGCAQDREGKIALPRGCMEDLLALFRSLGVHANIVDQRQEGKEIQVHFLGESAGSIVSVLGAFELGTFAAPPEFNRMAIAAELIHMRNRNALILASRPADLHRWMAELQRLLGIPIGQVDENVQSQTGGVDVASIHSLARLEEGLAYGYLLIDGCHLVQPAILDPVLRKYPAKYLSGFTSTATRKDGLHPHVFFTLGPLRFRIDPRREALQRSFAHKVYQRPTQFQRELDPHNPFRELYAALAADHERNQLIVQDIRHAIEAKRSPIVIGNTPEQLCFLAEQLKPFVRHLVFFEERDKTEALLRQIPAGEERVLFATHRLILEGCCEPSLDTLFLTVPLAWRGTLADYASILHQPHPAKKEVHIYDYIDHLIPLLLKMSAKRAKAYEKMGYIQMN